MIEKYLSKIESLVFSHKLLIIILVGLFIVRLPSLLEPLWYGDEAIYVTIGQEINRGGLLYVDIFDNGAPGIYYLAAWSMKLLGGTIWSFKFLLAVWLLPTMISFYYLAKFLFDKKTAILAASVLALFLATPIFEGNIVNNEILMILPTSIAIIFGLKKRYFLSGFFFSLALLLKFTGVFDFAAFFIFVVLTLDKKHYLGTIRNLVKLILGLALPLALTVVYFATQGAFSSYLESAFLLNLTYTNYGNEFIIPNGLFIVKTLPLFAVVVYFLWRVFSKKGRPLGKTVGNKEFLIIWLVFSYYGAVFGGRTYPHYLIQPIAPLSIIIGRTIAATDFRRLGLSIIGIIVVISMLLGFFPTRNIPYINLYYYSNFIKFAGDKMPLEEYQNSFNPNTSRNYAVTTLVNSCSNLKEKEICNNSKTDPDDAIYLWANQPSIYFLSKRKAATKYITAFHILGSDSAKKEVIQDLRNNKPKLIIVDENGPKLYPELDSLINSRYNLFAISEEYKIYQFNENPSIF